MVLSSDDKPTVNLETWLSQVTDGNRVLSPDNLEFASAKEMLEKVAAALMLPATQSILAAIRDNAEFNTVRKAHKTELVYSDVYLEALKPMGFKSGADCKKAVNRIYQNYVYSEEDNATIKELEGKINEALKVAIPKEAVTAPPPAAALA